MIVGKFELDESLDNKSRTRDVRIVTELGETIFSNVPFVGINNSTKKHLLKMQIIQFLMDYTERLDNDENKWLIPKFEYVITLLNHFLGLDKNEKRKEFSMDSKEEILRFFADITERMTDEGIRDLCNDIIENRRK